MQTDVRASLDALPMAAATLLAIDPVGLGGAVLRGPSAPPRDAWLARLRSMMATDAPWRRLPPGTGDDRLLGGLDLAATLAAGRPVAERGLLAEADGGVLLVPMAERLAPGTAGHVAAALDAGAIVVERDGVGRRMMARFAAVFLDEGEADETVAAALTERVAFIIAVDSIGTVGADAAAAAVEAARGRLRHIAAGDEVVTALATAALAIGVVSLRAAIFALRVARAAAAWAGRDAVSGEDAELAAALVLAPRATCLPAAEPQEPAPDTSEPEQPRDDRAADADGDTRPMEDRVIAAAQAAIPTDLLSALLAMSGPRSAAAAGRSGASRHGGKRGRPAGVRRGAPGRGARLAVVETLRAAAPWQRLRRAASGTTSPSRVLVRRDDFRIARYKEKRETLTIFAVDASGSAALHRLAEVKGAVELILAECYVRRDSVALVVFRGDRADLVLPPTRSLTRAKRLLGGQPGGGGTPLAAAIEAGGIVALAAARKGQTPFFVLLTDGKANVARDGRAGRAEAAADALAAAQAIRSAGIGALVLDTAPRPSEPARSLAAAMAARYIPLPYADAASMSRTVLAATTVA